eukprot:Tamp_23879.p1 GENE.Tamp_23879~~Tamp_23879.p1  ORF type:complete len:290 (-),score=64.04 Tamp_23879:97-966(-)
MPDLLQGGLVKIGGLKEAQKHNDAHGHLVRFNEDTGRWKVKLCAGGELGVKPANLEACPADKIFDNGNIKVEQIPGRGYGVVAVRAFERGSVLFQEAPLARVNKDTGLTAKRNAAAAQLMQEVYALASSGTFDPRDPAAWPEEVRERLAKVMDIQAMTVFNKASLETQTEWLLLQDGDKEGADKTPGGVLRTNGFDDDEGFVSLYATTSRANHSCDPSATRYAQGSDNSVQLVAARAIGAGEEIFVSYLDTSDAGGSGGMTVEERRSILQSKYGFVCECPLCIRESFQR